MSDKAIPISNMTDEQLNEAIAIEVMGWRKSYAKWYDEDIVQYSATTGKTVWYAEWNPANCVDQAFEVLDRWHRLSMRHLSAIYRNGEIYLVTLEDLTEIIAQTRAKNPTRAICEVVLQAIRGEE